MIQSLVIGVECLVSSDEQFENDKWTQMWLRWPPRANQKSPWQPGGQSYSEKFMFFQGFFDLVYISLCRRENQWYLWLTKAPKV